MVISSPKHKTPRRVYSPFTFVLSENVFCQGMVVLLNPVCVLLSGMLHVYERGIYINNKISLNFLSLYKNFLAENFFSKIYKNLSFYYTMRNLAIN